MTTVRPLHREILIVTITFALLSLVSMPLFGRGLPCSDDTLPHFYRTVQLLLLIEQGTPFLQWGPDLLRGYGYPIMAFYAPLTYWLLAALSVLGLGVGMAMQLLFFLALNLAGVGAYVLARCYLGPIGALIAGVAYSFSPYLLYDAIQRGALPETLALAFIPWALAAMDQVQVAPSWRKICASALLFALLILTHNVLPLFALGLAGLWAILPIHPTPDRRTWWQQVKPALLTLVLALGMTAFFWLPGLAELSYTQSRREDPPLRDWPRFEQHFVPPASLFGWQDELPDPDLLNPPVGRTLGVGQGALGLLGLWGLVVYPHGGRRRRLWLLAGLTAVSAFFSTSASFWWWGHFGPLNFIQLPTRFLGPASLGLALLSGVALDALWQRRLIKGVRIAAVYLAGTAVAVSGWPWLYAHYCPVPDFADRLSLAQATTWSRWYAEAQAELLPRWVDEMPEENGLMRHYEAGGPINRLELPPEVTLVAWETRPGWDRYELVVAAPAAVVYHTFYFPGWQARLDGTAVAITINQPTGLMVLELPAGQHHLEIAFRATPVRRFALFLSLLSVLVVLGLAIAKRYQRPVHPATAASTWPKGTGKVFLLLGLLLPGLKAAADYALPLLRQEGVLSIAMRPMAINFSGEFSYLGYSGPQEVRGDRPLIITQYWAPQREIGVPYSFALYVTDEQGQVWHAAVGRPFGYTDYPGELSWQTGKHARDAYQIDLLPGTPPGVYWLEVEGFRRDVAAALLPQDWPTGPNPARARVGQVQVTPGRWRLNAENAFVDSFAPTPLVDYPGLQLLGWTAPQAVWRPGAEAEVQLLWQQDGKSTERPSPIFLSLSNAGTEAARLTITPGGDHYPMTLWPDRAVVRDMIQWRLPAVLDSGHYALQLHAGDQVISLAVWQIEAPPRSFAPPPVTHTAVFMVPFAALQGYNLEETAVGPGETLHLELVWQALETAPESYRVFVHLLDGDGNLVTQSDAVPDNWTRPTTGWVPGEYIRDRHTLAVPPDAPSPPYRLRLGWYDAATGTRLGDTTIDLGANP